MGVVVAHAVRQDAVLPWDAALPEVRALETRRSQLGGPQVEALVRGVATADAVPIHKPTPCAPRCLVDSTRSNT